MPFPPVLLRDVLVLAPGVLELLGTADQISTRAGNVSRPAMLVRPAGNVPIESGYGMHSPLVQVEGLCPHAWTEVDPEVMANRIAWAAVDAVASIRNLQARGVAFSVRHIDGPHDDADVSRGTETPVYRSIVRFELTLRTV